METHKEFHDSPGLVPLQITGSDNSLVGNGTQERIRIEVIGSMASMFIESRWYNILLGVFG